MLASACDDGHVTLRRAGAGTAATDSAGTATKEWTLPEDQANSSVLAFSRDGTRLLTARQDGTLVLWDLAAPSPTVALLLPSHFTALSTAALAPDGGCMAAASWLGELRLWDATTGAASHDLEGHTEGITRLAFSPDGAHLASAGRDTTVRVWDVATGAVLHVLEGHPDGVMGCAFTAAGTLLASAGWDGEVRLWDRATGALVAKAVLPARATCVAAHPHRPLLVVGDTDGQVHRLEAAGVGFSAG